MKFKELFEKNVLKGKTFIQDTWNSKEKKWVKKRYPVEIKYDFVTYSNEKHFNSSSWSSWRSSTHCSYLDLNKTIRWINKWHEDWNKNTKLGPYMGIGVLTIYGSQEYQGDYFYDIRLDTFEIKNRNMKKELPTEFLNSVIDKLKKGIK